MYKKGEAEEALEKEIIKDAKKEVEILYPAKIHLLDDVVNKLPEKKPKKNSVNVFRIDNAVSFYLDVNSETYGDAIKSAIKAGIKPLPASVIEKNPAWKLAVASLSGLLNQAKDNINEFLTLDAGRDHKLLQIKQNSTHYVLDTLGKRTFNKTINENVKNNVIVFNNVKKINRLFEDVEDNNQQKVIDITPIEKNV